MVVYLTVHTLSVAAAHLNKVSTCKVAVTNELCFCASDMHWLLCHYEGLMKNLQVAVYAYNIYKYIHTYLNCTENMYMKIRSVTKSQFSPSNAALFLRCEVAVTCGGDNQVAVQYMITGW